MLIGYANSGSSKKFSVVHKVCEQLKNFGTYSIQNLRWWYTPAIMILMTFFFVKYLAKGADTEAK